MTTFDQVFALMLFAFVAAVTPGPSNIILASTGAQQGVRRGLPCLLGVTVGMGVMIFLVALGLGNLVREYPTVHTGLQWGGIGLLLWLSWKIATAPAGVATTPRESVGFWQAAALQWVSPKSWLISASAVGAYLQSGAMNSVAQSLALSVLFVLVALPSCAIWLVFGATLQRFLRTERTARAFNISMGVLLAGSIALFI